MKAKIKGLWALLLTQVLSLLGFNSCIFIPSAEYGCPHSDYTIKGTVTDEAGKPLQGIRVAIHRRLEPTVGVTYDDTVFAKDTLYTDKNGIVGYTVSDMTTGVADVWLDDVDGEANGGEFESMKISGIKAKQVKNGDGNWYNGAYAATFEARMKKK